MKAISGHTDQLKYSATIKENILSTSFSYTGKFSNVKISIHETTSSTPNHKTDDQGLSTTALVAFSICAVMFVLFVILGCVCQRRYTKIYDIFKIYQTGHSRRRTTDHPLHEIPLGEIEGIYEEIDEMNMTDNVGIPRDEDMSVDDTNGSYVQPDNNGYLTPFQPDDEYTSTDNSNDNKSQSLASTHDSHSFPIDHLSTSSSSDVQERRSSYLNPYQPIVHSADIHEYSSINIINESSSSGSDTLWKGSGYLNPYQPMVPDLDLHDYKSVAGCTGGSFSPMLDACTKDIVSDFPHLCQAQNSRN
ncbi:unnamed protein product [Mytilus edulis]|uniref:Uncharacterized protein n=1 Tax=Mytilus edulis TaxID=6550 RepID=A0A8S3VNB9_MYTED|nr:unnamed protein product [Mytilus edulis]